MDISGITATASQMSQSKTENAVQLAMLKKTLDIQAQGAEQLINAAAAAAPSNNPPNLGNSVNVFA